LAAPSIAPFEIVVTPINVKDETLLRAAIDLAAQLEALALTSFWMIATNGRESSSTTLIWSVSF